VNGRFQGISRGDILEVAERFGIEASRAILDEVLNAVARWEEFYRACHGSMSSTPVLWKWRMLRVATAKPRDAAVAAM
jgi:hypothetical protein